MTTVGSNTSDEERDLHEARAGDHAAFGRAVAPYRGELHRHCYRMTGSLDDADDLLQETLFRAWRSLGTYAGRASFRAWLYRIATNRSIDLIGASARRELPVSWGGEDAGREPMWLQPYPDTDPAAVAERREHIATAFVVAIQRLPPKQRAALLLKDVLGFSVDEISDTLDTTQAAINSALQRARASIRSDTAPRMASEAETALRDQLIDAWQRADVERLTDLTAQDVVLTMPPDPVWVRGAADVVSFLQTIAPGRRLDRMAFLPASASRQPAAALYLPDEEGAYVAAGVMTLASDGGVVRRITAFRMAPGQVVRFGLPEKIEHPS